MIGSLSGGGCLHAKVSETLSPKCQASPHRDPVGGVSYVGERHSSKRDAKNSASRVACDAFGVEVAE